MFEGREYGVDKLSGDRMELEKFLVLEVILKIL